MLKTHRRTVRFVIPLAVVVTVIAWFGGMATPGSAHAIVTARISPGTCGSTSGTGAIELGELTYAAPLGGSPEATPSGPYRSIGAGSAFVAVMTVTTIDRSLDQLLQQLYSVDIEIVNDETGETTSLACGGVGGVRNGNDLIFGLQTAPSEGVDTTGTVWLHGMPNGETLVRIFVSQGLGTPPEDAKAQASPAA
ncbi:MAG: hypothetical protein ACR2LS_06155 [Thermomicrobiales bacterium]